MHLLLGKAREVGVQQGADALERFLLEGQFHVQQRAFHAAVGEHHHGDHRQGIYIQQLKTAHRCHLAVVGGGVGGVVHEGGHHLSCAGDQLIGATQLTLHDGADGIGLLAVDVLALHELVDIEAVALGRGDAACAGVGLF